MLAADEPPAFATIRRNGTSPFLLTCDHASLRIPRSLGTLGLTPDQARTHIAWDIGALQVASLVAEALDATLLVQNYSRLVIDCNRPPQAADSIALESDAIRIPGNENLDAAARAARVAEIFTAYHEELTALLEQRRLESRRTLLVAMHSFTPTYAGVARPWHIGLMYRHDVRLGAALLPLLRAEPDLCVGDNQPYAIDEGIDYTLPLHGEVRGIPHLGIEIRQDLIADAAGQVTWAARLARLFPRTLATISP
ncbi:MAG: N-formylglutamate amidohydrolase [Steroidobacteraceae bacterium]